MVLEILVPAQLLYQTEPLSFLDDTKLDQMYRRFWRRCLYEVGSLTWGPACYCKFIRWWAFLYIALATLQERLQYSWKYYHFIQSWKLSWKIYFHSCSAESFQIASYQFYVDVQRDVSEKSNHSMISLFSHSSGRHFHEDGNELATAMVRYYDSFCFYNTLEGPPVVFFI